MINMANRPDVAVRLVTLKLCFRHDLLFRLSLAAFAVRYSVHLRLRREAGAGEGNRTLVISLEGCCSTIELHPPKFECLPRLTHSSSGSVVIRRALRTLNGGGGWIRTNVGVANGF